MKKLYKIAEFKSFIEEGKEAEGCVPLPKDTFKQLENFLIGYKQKSKDKYVPDIYSLGNRKAVGRVLTVQNYVGVITLPNGDSIEILPKTCLNVDDEEEVAKNRKLVLTMLKALKNQSFKCLNLANIDCKKMTILDVFVARFLEEVTRIVKRGLKSSYLSVEENCNFFKGKMLFAQQLKHNLLHKERNYVQYDQFSVNRAENRLIKATLQYLYRATNSTKFKKSIQQLLGYFEGVETSTNYAKDFAACVGGRGMETYVLALEWCKIFLEQRSITPMSGSQNTPSVLFSMQDLYEAYVGNLLQRELEPKGYTVILQAASEYLLDANKDELAFQLNPDIFIRKGEETYIMDTKWKLLDDKKPNFGVSRDDVYQMYAYYHKYKAKNITLIYPFTKQLSMDNLEKIKERSGKDGFTLKVRMIDLFGDDNATVEENIRELFESVL